MGLNSLIQTPTPPNMPNFSDKILTVNKIGDTGGTYGEGIYAGQPVNPGGIPRENTKMPNRIPFSDHQMGAGPRPYLPPRLQQPPQQNPYGALFGLSGLSNIMNIPGQMTGFGETLGGYGETLGGFGEQMTGFGEQMTGYQDALGGFNEQIGGFGKQFETVNNKLDSMEKGIAGLDQQLQTQQQQQVQQPQQQQYQNPFSSPYSNPFGSMMYGGLGSLFGRRY